MTAQLYCGDVRAVLATLPEESVQCCVTSPPYWGLRDYGVPGQIGLERTPGEYVAAMVDVFRAVWRGLRDDGVLWLNLGDSYAAAFACARRNIIGEGSPASDVQRPNRLVGGLKNKDLIGIPWRVAFALQADGWYLRSEVIWAKPNPMPESVTDRPTKAHEQIFLLTKSARYYYDLESIREPVSPNWGNGNAPCVKEMGAGVKDGTAKQRRLVYAEPKGANARSVWSIATQPYAGAHFATFPEELARRCILAGSSAKACEHCGAPWERVTERESSFPTGDRVGHPTRYGDTESMSAKGFGMPSIRSITTTTGWQPTCDHENVGAGQSVVLDPFGGSGTTAAVAVGHGRAAVHIDLNPAYIELARQRIGPMLCEEVAHVA